MTMFTARMKIALILLCTSAYISVNGFADTLCTRHEFECDNGRNCLPKRWVCDDSPDCKDGTDELPENCDQKPDRNCSSIEFQCRNNKCLPVSWKCDGQDDCGDKSDESNCSGPCKSGEHACGDGMCITDLWVCDGTPDCTDASDEKNCTKLVSSAAPPPIDPMYFFCDNGRRLPKSYKCDGDKDCDDSSDEQDCGDNPVVSPVRCLSSEFECDTNGGGYCILQSWVCDGQADCEGAEDERNCQSMTCSDLQFKCGSGECIPGHERCNGFNDCRDRSDEQCAENESVAPANAVPCDTTTHFQCGGSSGLCIPQEKLCNGLNDCGDWQDESEVTCSVNECDRSNGGCEQQCNNTREGYFCSCNPGYRLHGKYSCEDIDECSEVLGSCSQICINTVGSFHCMCQHGYLRDPHNYTRCKAAVGEAYLLFSHSYDIRSLRLRDKDMRSIVSDIHGATALDFHFQNNQILWSDRKDRKIYRANMADTKTTREVVASGDEVSADGLAVDWIHGHIYYTDTRNFAVRMVSWDAMQWTKTLVTEDVGQPRAIAVSPMTGYVYWSDWGSDPKIERAGLDGAHRSAIIRTPHVVWPNGITIDHSTDRLYWCDGRLKTISSSRLDGSHVEVILFSNSVLRLPYSISVFEDRLYWTDHALLALYSADKFTGADVHNMTAGHLLESPKVVHVFHQYRQPAGENICASHHCSHICVRGIQQDRVCACPDGFHLTGDNITCAAAPPSTTTIRTTLRPVVSIDIHQNININTNNEPPPPPPQQQSVSAAAAATAAEWASVAEGREEELQGTLQQLTAAAEEATSQIGLILGLVLGVLAGLGLGLVAFVGYSKFRRPHIRRFRFHNPVYRKTTDEEVAGDGRGFTIAQEQLFYNPTGGRYAQPDPTLTLTEADDAPLTPEDGNSGA